MRPLLVLLAACGSSASDTAPDAAAPDAAPVPIDAQLCFGSYHYCFAAAPTGTLTVRDTLDADHDLRCAPEITDVCAIGARDLVVSQQLRVTGTRPVALIARTIQVDGQLTVAKNRGRADDCVAPAAAGSLGGGAGGSFVTVGGDGGKSKTGGGGLASPASAVPAALRGGCPGDATSTTGLAAGGLALIATERIAIYAGSLVDACGTGGAGHAAGGAGGAGSGGGSGGLVVLDAPDLALDGTILALGGGGGGGADSMSDGSAGLTACTTAGSTNPGGGSGATMGGSGASTGPATSGAGTSVTARGGAGGGGGLGAILVRGTVSGAGKLLPAATSF